jgi:hypothetical protein
VSLTRSFLILGAAWAFGYSVSWTAKWTLVALFTSEEDVFGSIGSYVFFRLGRPGEVGGSVSDIWRSTAENLWQARVGIMVVAVLLSLRALWSVRRPRSVQALLPGDVLLAAAVVFTIPFLWFVAARQHSIAHSFYFASILYPNFAIVVRASLNLSPAPAEEPAPDGT